MPTIRFCPLSRSQWLRPRSSGILFLMDDAWRMFPATMGDDQAFISFNDSFAARAESDARGHHLRVEVPIKDPTEAGMPRGDEFTALSKLDDALDAAVARLGGVYVGRITVAGRRFFYFYLDASEADARAAVVAATASTGYAAQIRWMHDPQKRRYWEELYPTADDWRVIKDMSVLDALAEAGDNPDLSRTVEHWAYFDSEHAAEAFREWLGAQGFTFKSSNRKEDGRVGVTFTHEGVMHLADLTNHTIRCRRKPRSSAASTMGGRRAWRRDKRFPAASRREFPAGSVLPKAWRTSVRNVSRCAYRVRTVVRGTMRTSSEGRMSQSSRRKVVKKAANLSVRSDLLSAAREAGVNLSAALEEALAQKLAIANRERWARENADAIAAYNEFVAEQGVLADDSRTF